MYRSQPVLWYLKHKEPFKKSEFLYNIGKRCIKAKKDKKFLKQGLCLIFLVCPTKPCTESALSKCSMIKIENICSVLKKDHNSFPGVLTSRP